MNMANRVTGRGNPKNTVLKSITSKLQKIDAEMKNRWCFKKYAETKQVEF